MRIWHAGVDETVGNGAVPDLIGLELLLGLIGAALPREIRTMRTWIELPVMGPTEGEPQRSRTMPSALTLLKFRQAPAGRRTGGLEFGV